MTLYVDKVRKMGYFIYKEYSINIPKIGINEAEFIENRQLFL